MAREARPDRRGGRGALALGALTLTASCANIFGIEDWQDPHFDSSSGQAGGSSISVSSGGGGGAGGSSSSSGGGAGGTGGAVHFTTGASMCNEGGSGGVGGLADPTCADCVKNGLETDVDCGGDSCAPCVIGADCQNGTDCKSGHCLAGACAPAPPPCVPGEGGAGGLADATCADCVKNGLETDIDCGGDSCDPCAQGALCLTAADCESGVCQGSACQ